MKSTVKKKLTTTEQAGSLLEYPYDKTFLAESCDCFHTYIHVYIHTYIFISYSVLRLWLSVIASSSVATMLVSDA